MGDSSPNAVRSAAVAPQLPEITSLTTSDVPAAEVAATMTLSESADLSEPTELLDVIEQQLEASGDADLADELYAALSRERVVDPSLPLMRAVVWLHRQHFEAGGSPRP